MTRLTIRNSDGSVSQPTHSTFEKVFNKLAEYEDLGKTPEELRKILLRYKVLEFNAEIKELESKGFRSGGYDMQTRETAIVKEGDAPHKNEIVGYMDDDLNIRWIK